MNTKCFCAVLWRNVPIPPPRSASFSRPFSLSAPGHITPLSAETNAEDEEKSLFFDS